MDGMVLDSNVEQIAPKKNRRGRWVKGESGNPGGRKALPGDIVKLCQQYGPMAIRRLIDHAASADRPVSIRACEVILNRAYGTAPQSLKIMGDDANPLVLEIRASAEQLHKRMLGLVRRA